MPSKQSYNILLYNITFITDDKIFNYCLSLVLVKHVVSNKNRSTSFCDFKCNICLKYFRRHEYKTNVYKRYIVQIIYLGRYQLRRCISFPIEPNSSRFPNRHGIHNCKRYSLEHSFRDCRNHFRNPLKNY